MTTEPPGSNDMTDTAPNPAAAAPLAPIAPPHGVPAPSHEQVAAAAADDRLASFRREVGELKVTGGAANPERNGARLGLALVAVGLVGAALCWYTAYNAGRFEEIQRMIIAGAAFVGVGVVGVVVWLRNSMTRYFRFWLVRLVYEQREQTEQLVDAQREQMDRLIATIRENDPGRPA
jgi:hypothetical protein